MRHFILILILLICFLFASRTISSELNSNNQLRQAWETYKSFFIQQDGRVIDFKGNNITTSEGQSYALLRAVWMNDRSTFDKVLNWSNSNLRIRGDNLFSWKWGEDKNGQWTILDKSSATDADQDIALALILAYEKWNDKKYLAQAQLILNDMWNKTVINIKGDNYLAAGEWAINKENVKLNPSYLAPYAYRIFAKYDIKHDWNSLVKSTYIVLNKTSDLSACNLPPDWAYINKKTGQISIDDIITPKESDYSYDAIRTQWRIALDYVLYNDKKALKYLNKSTDYLIKYWESYGILPSSIAADGSTRNESESYPLYGAILPAVGLINKNVAMDIYNKKINAEYVKGFWANPKDYYTQNITWFGIALWNDINNNGKPLSKRGLVNLLN